MKENLQNLYHRHESFILYALYGIPPSVLNFCGYSALIHFFYIDATISAVLAWIASLFLSFWLYRKFVFKTPPAPLSEMAVEFLKFSGVRAGTGLFEVLCVWVFVTMMNLNPYIFKILASLLSIVINYIVSKTRVFRKNELS